MAEPTPKTPESLDQQVLSDQARAWYVRLLGVFRMPREDRVTLWCLFQLWWTASEANQQAFRAVVEESRP